MLYKKFKYITVNKFPPAKGKKTCTCSIDANSSGCPLGEIRWFGRWRQYCFFPEQDTVWNKGCLQDVIEALDSLNREHREGKSND